MSFWGRGFHTIVAFRGRVNFKAKRIYSHRSKYGVYPQREGDQIMLKFRTISRILDFRVLHHVSPCRHVLSPHRGSAKLQLSRSQVCTACTPTEHGVIITINILDKKQSKVENRNIVGKSKFKSTKSIQGSLGSISLNFFVQGRE